MAGHRVGPQVEGHSLKIYQGPLLLKLINFNPSMDKYYIHYLSIPKLQQWSRWSLGMDK